MMNTMNTMPLGGLRGGSPLMGPSPMGGSPLMNPSPMGAPGAARDPYSDLAGILAVLLQAMGQGQGAGQDFGQGLGPQGPGQVPGLGQGFGAGQGLNGFTDPSGFNSPMNFDPGLANFNSGGIPDLGSWMDGFQAGANAASAGGGSNALGGPLGGGDPFGNGCNGACPVHCDPFGSGSGADPFSSSGNDDDPFNLGSDPTTDTQPAPPVTNNTTNNNTTNNNSKEDKGDTPVILDVNGDGKLDTTGKGGPKVNFDLNGDGKSDNTEWMKKGGQDGLLVSDFNGDGQINNGSELMRRTGENGEQNKYKNGWDKVSKLHDKNQDGTVNGKELNGMQMWMDGNGDGKTDPGELKSLRSLGISSIDVPKREGEMDSTFTRNGNQQLARDVSFDVGRWG